MEIDKLEVEGIIYGFGVRNLLTDVYLKCEVGEIVGVLGRNGSGKSSLLKIIFGTLNAENKMIRVNNKIVNSAFSQIDLISYLPQSNFIPKTLTLRTIIAKYIPLQEKRDKIINDPHVENHLDKRVSNLSGGELRYFQILLLLNLESTFVLLDEPFSAIEPLYKEKIKDLIRNYKKVKGFIVTDHDYHNVLDLCGSIKLIVNGVFKHIKSVDELESWGYVPKGTFK